MYPQKKYIFYTTLFYTIFIPLIILNLYYVYTEIILPLYQNYTTLILFDYDNLITD